MYGLFGFAIKFEESDLVIAEGRAEFVATKGGAEEFTGVKGAELERTAGIVGIDDKSIEEELLFKFSIIC